ncbi:hypothetical protein V5O48_012187 [Marasmius crinis-equi]|uniref:RING-type domain-containing protein n=1 Tax=Marasmius crinis-equi TaxID=585013 RepID=A0ABR3F3J8_9AGAR
MNDDQQAAVPANYAATAGNATDNATNNPQAKDGKDKKSPDSLFGPNIGVISGGPAWTVSAEKKMLKDELTMDIVKTWIEKSKEPSQPTTTLQALVNLKRPTLRLSPLAVDSEHPEESHSQHALEFEYDCDAPKCGLYVHVLLPPGHPEAPSTEVSADSTTASSSKPRYTKVLVFESVVDGGFGKLLKLEEGAVLELGRYEMQKGRSEPASPVKQKEGATDQDAQDAAGASNSGSGSRNHGRHRITHLFRRKRHEVSVSGPALAVVDASSPPTGNDGNTPGTPPSGEKKKDDADEGVKVTIRLVALDEQGTELESPNEQITYLCVERFGPRVSGDKNRKSATETPGVENSEQAGSSSEKEQKDGESAEENVAEGDARPWVVKVVKREATIGPHTFQLHEIYGLTSSHSSGAHAPAPTAPLPAPDHTYPPQQQPPAPQADDSDDSTSECLLCLSSPREVVLLPCRHLVACKECALNMVEFGAGGAITQGTAAADEPGNAGGEANTAGAEGVAAAGANANGAAAPANPRRKRKAKGWFCPVCRQPYTSLLRITTNPPPVSVAGKEDRPSQSQDEERDVADNTEAASGLPLPVTAAAQASGGTGLLSRPGEFFRSLTSRSIPTANANTAAGETGGRRDIENQL